MTDIELLKSFLENPSRANVITVIGKATDLPKPVRVAATLYITRLPTSQFEAMAAQVKQAVDLALQGDRPGFENILSSLGLPSQFVQFVSTKAFEHAIDSSG